MLFHWMKFELMHKYMLEGMIKFKELNILALMIYFIFIMNLNALSHQIDESNSIETNDVLNV